MLSISSKHLDDIDADIADAMGLIAQQYKRIQIALRKGDDTEAAEGRIREMRAAMLVMQEQRSRIEQQSRI